jgi:hypothetical protein
MQNPSKTVLSALLSGTIASVVSSTALAILADAEGKSAPRPTNATSHWLHGETAGSVRGIDAAHTATGYAIHHGACVLWALVFEWVVAGRKNISPSEIPLTAAGVSILAAAVDYIITPKRFTPGWEAVLTKRSIAGVYVATALGLALGGLFTWRMRHTDSQDWRLCEPVEQVSERGAETLSVGRLGPA